MQKKTMIIGSAAASGVLLLGGVAAVNASDGAGLTGGERDDTPLTGSTLSKASDAAIEAAGGGKVTETERSDDGDSAYDVEVTLDNGDQVDVELNEDFNVVHKESDAADDENDRDDDDGARDDADEKYDDADDGPQDEADDAGEHDDDD